MKVVKATVLAMQRVETRLPVTVRVADDADDQDIFRAVIEAAEEKVAEGLAGIQLTPSQLGWNRSDGFAREVIEPEIPSVGEPVGPWEGAATWDQDDIVEILDVS